MVCSVPVNVVVCQLMMYSNLIVDITISLGSFVFSQSRVQVSATDVRSLTVGAFDPREGGGVLPIMAYMGRLPPKGLPFSGVRYLQ